MNFSKCCHLKIGVRHREVNYELTDPDGVKQEMMMEEWVSDLRIFQIPDWTSRNTSL